MTAMNTARRSTLRRYRAATAVLVLVPTLAACGFGVQSNKQYQSGAGTDNRDGVIQVMNAAIVIPQVGATNGVFVGTFVNNSANDPAEDASYTAGQTATVSSMAITNPSGGTVAPNITLAPNASYNPQPTAQPGDHGIPVTVPSTVSDGGYVTMQFVITAGTSQTVTMNVPVFPASAQNSFYAKYLPATTLPH